MIVLENTKKVITRLEQIVSELTLNERELFDRIFRFSVSTGPLYVPDSFREIARKYFRRENETLEEMEERISAQTIVKIFNKCTLEGALFNELRTCKPGASLENIEDIKRKVFVYIDEEKQKKGCDFCSPYKNTPRDIPRISKNGHTIAANVAKYDAYHGLVIFNEQNHNPFMFTQEDISDCLDLGYEWFMEMHNKNSRLIYPFLMWNCMPKAGASLIHAHMQLLITDDMPYAGTERLKVASKKYKKKYSSNYFRDLFSVHKSISLGFETEENNKIVVYLTPVKDKETLIFSDNLDGLKKSVYKVLRCFIDRLGVFAFNLGIQMPSINRNGNDCWEGFPYIARVVDRGNPFSTGNDWGGMEIFENSVIGSDPFKVADVFQSYYLESMLSNP